MMISSGGPLTGGKNRKYREKIKELEEKLELQALENLGLKNEIKKQA